MRVGIREAKNNLSLLILAAQAGMVHESRQGAGYPREWSGFLW